MTTISESVRVLKTRHFGEIEWSPQSEIVFPCGLPGFEDERRIIAVEIPALRPLVYLQSADHEDVCFLALPAQTISPSYSPALTDYERTWLLLPDKENLEIGVDILCLFLLIPSGDTVQVNLNAPVVINLHNLLGVQCEPLVPACSRVELTDRGTWDAVC